MALRIRDLRGALASLASIACALAGCAAGPASQVVLIVVDTLRADHLGAYEYARPTSPHLDAWVESGRLFERAFATSPWTLPSVASIYTGLLPGHHAAGAIVWKEGPKPRLILDPERFYQLDEKARTLAEVLEAQGYETAALMNNPFLAPMYGVGRGFETYDYVAGDNDKIRRADAIVDLALAWVEAHRDGKFFLVLHFFDPHMNYDAPPPFRHRFTKDYSSKLSLPVRRGPDLPLVDIELDDEDWRFIVAAYDEELAFVDEQLGRLLEGLDARGVLDRGLVILTSDHGEEFFEHGGFEHGHAMWQELLHVPLIVWGGEVARGRDAAPVSIADLAPTLLQATGQEIPQGLDGVSLWSRLVEGTPIPARSLYAEGTLTGPERMTAIRWPDKLMIDLESDEPYLVNLDADPEERTNAAEDRGEIAEELFAELEVRRRRYESAPPRRKAAKLDPATRKALRALGYVQ